MISRGLLLFSLFFLVNPAGASGQHVAFDLDGTLVQTVTTEVPGTDPDQLIVRGEETLRLNDFAPEVIAKLLDAGYQISIFSGSPVERNQVILERLKKLVRARAGRDFVPYKVLSLPDLTPVYGVPETARQRDRFRKDLQRIDNPFDVVLVDDIKEFVLSGQERNHLPLSPDIKTIRERQKLLVIMEVLLEARELLDRVPVQYLQAVQGLAQGSGPGANYNDEAYSHLMRKALRRFGLNAQLTKPAYPQLLKVKSCRSVWN